MLVSSENMPTTKEDFKELVGKKSFRVEFIKNDETKRIMNATLNFKLIPKEDWPRGLRVLPPHQVAVYDLERNLWRSFKIYSLKKLEIFKKIVATDYALSYRKKGKMPTRKEKNNIKKHIYYFEKFDCLLDSIYKDLLL
jgi:hypothetical protein